MCSHFLSLPLSPFSLSSFFLLPFPFLAGMQVPMAMLMVMQRLSDAPVFYFFLPRDSMLGAVYTVVVCLSASLSVYVYVCVCVCDTPVLY